MYLLRSEALLQLINLAQFVEEDVADLTLPTSRIYGLVMLTSRIHINRNTGEVDSQGVWNDLGIVSDLLLTAGAFDRDPELEQALGMMLWLAQEYHRFPVALLAQPEGVAA